MAAKNADPIEQLTNAQKAEDVFGIPEFDVMDTVRHAYRELAKLVHPDLGGDAELLKKLNELYESAIAAIGDGTYGQPSRIDPIKVTTKVGEVILQSQFARGDLSVLYRTNKGILKVASKPVNNDLVMAEASALKALRKDASKWNPFFPELKASFLFQEGSVRRRANLFEVVEGLIPLTEVRRVYPDGIDTRDMAWMFRRILALLSYVHENEYIHGAVLPSHILIHPEYHGVVLIDWCHSVKFGNRIKAISGYYKGWYPPEVMNKKNVTPATDIYMATETMSWLLGGQPGFGILPRSAPMQIRSFLRGTLLDKPQKRPQDAWDLLEEFTELIERLYGPRKFRPFSLAIT